jgi:hypothetical protein
VSIDGVKDTERNWGLRHDMEGASVDEGAAAVEDPGCKVMAVSDKGNNHLAVVAEEL